MSKETRRFSLRSLFEKRRHWPEQESVKRLNTPILTRREIKLPMTRTEAHTLYFSEKALANWRRQFGLLSESEISKIIDANRYLLEQKVKENIGSVLEKQFRDACRIKGGKVNKEGRWHIP